MKSIKNNMELTDAELSDLRQELERTRLSLEQELQVETEQEHQMDLLEEKRYQ